MDFRNRIFQTVFQQGQSLVRGRDGFWSAATSQSQQGEEEGKGLRTILRFQSAGSKDGAGE